MQTIKLSAFVRQLGDHCVPLIEAISEVRVLLLELVEGVLEVAKYLGVFLIFDSELFAEFLVLGHVGEAKLAQNLPLLDHQLIPLVCGLVELLGVQFDPFLQFGHQLAESAVFFFLLGEDFPKLMRLFQDLQMSFKFLDIPHEQGLLLLRQMLHDPPDVLVLVAGVDADVDGQHDEAIGGHFAAEVEVDVGVELLEEEVFGLQRKHRRVCKTIWMFEAEYLGDCWQQGLLVEALFGLIQADLP